MKRALVTGAAGMLGRDLMNALEGGTYDYLGIDKAEADLGDYEAVEAIMSRVRPDLVFHLAAMTAVDQCEEATEEAFRVNALGARNVACCAESAGAAMILVSTDYVFDGRGTRPYETWDETAPINVYGRSKLEGERLAVAACRRVLIVRTSWLYGLRGRNFVESIMSQVESGKEHIAVVDDQRGSPTYARDLADLLLALASRFRPGLLHATGGGDCTWRDFAEEIVLCSGHEKVQVDGMSTAEAARPAPRPAYSVLSDTTLRLEGFTPMRPWRDALRVYIQERILQQGGSPVDK